MSRSREEALRLGIKVRTLVHHATRRAPWHDYNHRGEYGITIHINEDKDGCIEQCLLLGRIEGDTRLMPNIDDFLAHLEEELPPFLHFSTISIPREATHAAMENLIPASRRALAASLLPAIIGGEAAPPHIVLSSLGRLVEQKIKEIGTHRYEEHVRAAYYVILPTHLHVILSVGEDLPMHTVRGKDVPVVVGNIMRGFEAGVTPLFYRLLDGETVEEILAHPDAGRKNHNRPMLLGIDGKSYPAPSVWSPDGFNDRILINEEKYLAWLRYLALNPYYWKLCQNHPDLFTHVLHITIADVDYSAYGCMFLLRRPERRQVFCHRFKMNADVMNKYFAHEKSKRNYYVNSKFTSDKDEYLPISVTQYNLSNGAYTQNPGYASFN